jgi:CRISPR/Cas system-associated exonuclease Cas4 (RecB family)
VAAQNRAVDLAHEFSWSVSRDSQFGECARSYYYTYYLSWGGWTRSAPESRRRAYRLKKLNRLASWAGDSLHVALAEWFETRRRSGVSGEPASVRDRALARLRLGYRQSRDDVAAWERSPSKSTRLAEHYYREPSVDEASGEARRYGTRYVERIERSVENFFGDERLRSVRESDPSTWLACEQLGTIELFGAKIYAVPDFALRTPEGIAILDWKTGSPRERDRFQLALYALYAEATWGAEPTSVRCADVYLPSGEIVEQRFERSELDEALGVVESSIVRMRALHFDAGRTAGDAEHFPMLPEGDPTCGRCNYRELCQRS